MSKSFKNRAFTLVEFLVAMSIFVVVTTVVLSLFSAAIKSYRRVSAMQNVQENARFLTEFMTKEIRMSIIKSSTPTTLVLTRSDDQSVSYVFSGNKLERTSPSSSGPINSEEVLINGRFYVEGIGTGDRQQPKVTIIMKVESTGGKVEEKAKIDVQTTLSQRLIDL